VEIHFVGVEEPQSVVCLVEEEEDNCMHGALPWERRKGVGRKAH
jgi:hypothetical protein